MRNFIETGSINEKLSKSPGFFKQICVIAPFQKTIHKGTKNLQSN